MDESLKLQELLISSFVLWLTDITAAGLLGYLAAVTLRAAAAERGMDLTRIHAVIWNDTDYSACHHIYPFVFTDIWPDNISTDRSSPLLPLCELFIFFVYYIYISLCSNFDSTNKWRFYLQKQLLMFYCVS